MGLGAAAAVGAVATVGSSLISSSASSKAAAAQTAADQAAAAQQQAQFEQTQANLAPYNTTGQANLPTYGNFYQNTQNNLNTAFNAAQNAIPGTMTQASLQNTPGYQFQLQQGLRAVQNSAAAKGLGVSGAALQGAGSYATGLANSNYQQQFANQQTQFTDAANQYTNALNGANTVYNQLSGPVSMGENAAATVGNQGVQSSGLVGQDLTAGGVAQSAGITGSAAGLGNALSAAGNSPLNYLAAQKAFGSTSSDNSGGGVSGTSPNDGVTVDTSGWGNATGGTSS